MTRLRPAAWVSAILLAAPLLAGCATGHPAATTGLPPCATILLIGVRGSGEDAATHHALGATLDDLYGRLATGYPHATTGYGLPYAAQGTGADIVDDAGTRLAALIRQRHQHCPH